ncbi:uncharacterized protein LOC123558704 [Mercenaria mercenaria]|uniref:uncharacterized protein LOC123558704 n=1 Tax=Mercenaria mercenaria TaxID=6596 RepID=UPI00234E9154|nr:uncharacterized protein LOC123558704 [Mercenaria mercenaria]
MAMLKSIVLIMCLHSLTYSGVEAVPSKKTNDVNKGDVQLATKDDIRNVLELMKIQEQKMYNLEKEVKIRDKALARQSAAVFKLERIVLQQSQKISRLELDASERNAKLKTKLKSFGENCNMICKFDGSVSNYSNTMESKSSSADESEEAARKGHPDQMTKIHFPNREIRRVPSTKSSPSIAVSFSVYLSHLLNHLGEKQVVKFDRVITNNGNGYNTHTGVFTVPVTGTYVFIFYVSSSDSSVEFNLMADDSLRASGIARPNDFSQDKDVQGGGTVILHLNQGVSVWIQNTYAESIVFSTDTHRWVTFSGFLLY